MSHQRLFHQDLYGIMSLALDHPGNSALSRNLEKFRLGNPGKQNCH